MGVCEGVLVLSAILVVGLGTAKRRVMPTWRRCMLLTLGPMRVVHAWTTSLMSSLCRCTWKMGMQGLSSIVVWSQLGRAQGYLLVSKNVPSGNGG